MGSVVARIVLSTKTRLALTSAHLAKSPPILSVILLNNVLSKGANVSALRIIFRSLPRHIRHAKEHIRIYSREILGVVFAKVPVFAQLGTLMSPSKELAPLYRQTRNLESHLGCERMDCYILHLTTSRSSARLHTRPCEQSLQSLSGGSTPLQSRSRTMSFRSLLPKWDRYEAVE